MNRDELKFLFETYLKRNFSENEWKIHGNKNVIDFENEIRTCKEFLDINKLTNNDIKICFLMSGHIRKNSVLNGLLTFCNNMNYDVFIHTWDNIGLKGDETNLQSKNKFDHVNEQINRIPNVRKFEIENNKLYIDSLEDIRGYFNFSSPEKFIKSQLYSINKSYKLMEEYSIENNIVYDVVIKTRFDCSIDEFIITRNMCEDIQTHNIIFVPNKDNKHSHPDYGTSCWACDNMYYKHKLKDVHIFEHTNVICDLFSYGSMSSMKKYCSLYDEYDDMINSFKEDNNKSLGKHNSNVKLVDGDYKFNNKGHIDSLYYFYCSYPERLLQKYLKDFMLIESKQIKMSLVR